MTACRDWTKTLWSASYRGQAFYFESDEETGGRGIVEHNFPNRDDPYIEDLGENPRYFRGTAYVHGDDADAQANRLIDSLLQRGPARLVIPIRGPVLVHCKNATRKHERDKLGYIAFQVEFVREGAAFGLVSIPALASLARVALGALGGVASSLLAGGLSLANVPDFVSAAARGTLGEGLGALDLLRETFPVDPVASLAARNEIDALVSGVAALSPATLPALAGRVFEIVQTLADSMPPASAARAMRQFADQFPPVSPVPAISPLQGVQIGNVAVVSGFFRVAALAGETEAILRREFVARPDGVAARADLAMRFEAEMLLANGAAHAALYRALDDARGRAIDYLSKVINDLAPVIEVESNRVLPSLYWSFRLYGDAFRGTELAQRNLVRNPAFMPTVFSALAT